MNYFGTDGIRDNIDGPLLRKDFIYQLGKAVAIWIRRRNTKVSPHVIIGRDTRGSGEHLMMTLARGLYSEGLRIFNGGVCPTPAVAVSIRMLDLDMGFAITASHNPATDNGIKLFGPGGCKLTVQDELEIEEILDDLATCRCKGSGIPPMRILEARRHYLESIKSMLPSISLMGLKIAVDCGNGSTFRTTPDLLRRLRAQVFTCGTEPDGSNINAWVGSEFPGVIRGIVLNNEADLGIAHDGDGDRVLMCDSKGTVLDGDAVLAILGSGMARRGSLANNTIVATIMSNMGLDHCLEAVDVKVERVDVGDRQVYYRMKERGHMLGGESSGHFIAMEHLPTGDGLLAAMLVLNEMILTGQPLHQLAAVYKPFPQLKKNIAVADKPPLEELAELQTELSRLQESMIPGGRILLRYSGTQSMIRLLAEGPDEQAAGQVLRQLEEIVTRHLPVDG